MENSYMIERRKRAADVINDTVAPLNILLKAAVTPPFVRILSFAEVPDCRKFVCQEIIFTVRII